MKQIWIDGYEANVPQRVGSGQLAYKLISVIEKLDQQNSYTIVLPSAPLEDMPKVRKNWCYKILKPRPFWTWIALPLNLFTTKNKPDVIFSPTHYAPGFSPVKRVSMIFDLGYEVFPQFFKPRDLWQLRIWTFWSAWNVNKLIAISQSAKSDAVKYYKIPNDKVIVSYPGPDNLNTYKPLKDQKKITEVKNKYGIKGDYVIFVSTLNPKKNVIRLIEAFEKIENLKLVIVGKTTGEGRSGWMFEKILSRPKELGIEEKVTFTGFAPDEDLPVLINGSLAYVQPSLYEGFGIPTLNAMYCGVPVIVSKTASLPEVVGDAGVLFDPYSVEDIREKIEKVVSDKKLRTEMIEKGFRQAKKFSWEKMAKEVIGVLESV